MIINIYSDDVVSDSAWAEICEQANVEPDNTDKLTFVCVDIITNTTQEELEALGITEK